MLIQIKYKPRDWFMPFHMRTTRWATVVAHRRAGKTVAAVNDIIARASRNPREDPQYGYIAPYLKQAKAIAWKYLKNAAMPFNPKISEAELYVELRALPNSPRITIYGADNPESFRGMYFDGVVLDEFGNMVESTFTEILLPTLMDRNGWGVFMGTPNGPNHFRDMYYAREDDPDWFSMLLPVTKTKLFNDKELDDMRKIMDPEQYAQEMLCSFEASVRGAIYARQMEEMIASGRIGDYPFDRLMPVDLIMDLGYRDLCVMGFAQARPDGVLMGHSYGDNMKPIAHYIDYAKKFWEKRRLKPGRIYLPHDAKAKSLQTGKAIIDHFWRAQLHPKMVTELDLMDGIAATRTMFDSWYINETENKTLVLALKSYHRKYDEDTKTYSDEPVHDWSSHYADMWRYASIMENQPDVADFMRTRGLAQGLAPYPARSVHYGFSLDELWETAPTQSRRL